MEVAQKGGQLQVEIADFGRSQGVQYRASLPDGSPLPAWIQVDPQTGRITAEPGSDTRLIQLVFSAQDANGNVRMLEIKIDLSQPVSSTDQPAGTAALVGRPAFMSQVAAHQQQWDGYGEQLLSSFTAH